MSVKAFKRIIVLFISSSFLCIGQAQASPEREFIMSCTYGVLAGTLVGAASLAFVDKPSDNLQQVARGASLGLYLGIALGLYTVYILPNQIEKEENRRLEEGAGGDDASIPPVLFFPIVTEEHGVEGAGAFMQVATF